MIKKTLVMALSFPLLAIALGGCQTLNKGSFGDFRRSLNNTSYGYTLVADPTGTAPTAMIERFEVQPGDCASSPQWSDCDNDRERSELTGSKDNHRGKSYWYGWSMFVPHDYPNVCPTKTALGQFHQTNAPPAFMFQNSCGGLWIDRNFGASASVTKLIEAADLRGRWHQIEVHAKWAKRDGFLKVFVNGAQKWSYRGKTNSSGKIYFKYGVYRSFMSRYLSKYGVDKVPAQIVYYANVRRASTRGGLRAPRRAN